MNIILTTLLLLISPITTSNELIVTHNNEEIANVNREQFLEPFVDDPIINWTKYQAFTQELGQIVYTEPKNAYINQQGKIISGELGYQLHEEKFTELFYAYLLNHNNDKMIEVPLLSIHPNVDSELLANIRTERIGHYLTHFNAGNKERAHNITLAAEAIDSHVVFPNQTFSFNEVVGKRTKEKGYLPAPEIVKGELTEGIGGGICQVSSTLFNAVDRAGVQIVERYSHSKSVPYVPKGRDATVSWYGPDFTFENTLNQPLLIRAKVSGGQMVINVFSSENVDYTPREVPNAAKQLSDES
ncbi:VanW family protein [Gracilibacillus sp. S3-1-1]|uniref:VanW family protein n=1 Tax=Gracilibacillus pellucidus TaxID=3095368 RepID=A0ACC6M8W7_9BACI|nr:VanW family protein [Gracilibacillus sp. S3-1-1]MDX8047326.1 VanW family protein [Gracilibacillus sp. S3-1-1]